MLKLALPRPETPGHFGPRKLSRVKMSSCHGSFHFQSHNESSDQETLASENLMRPIYLGCMQRKDGHDMDLAIGCSGLSLNF